MNKIKLNNPVVLYFDKGTSESDKETIIDFLKYRKCFIFGESSLEMALMKDRKGFDVTGIDAAKLYCKLHNITLHTVEEIDVDDIVSKCDDIDALYDIIHLIRMAYIRNERVGRFKEQNVPEIVQFNERRVLQEKMEQLAYNCCCDPCAVDDEGQPLHSLSCIGYKL